MKEPIILKDISFSFGTRLVLEKFNLAIKNGSFHSLIGISGTGKTLTLKLLASLIPLQTGEIEGLPAKINYAFQSSPLIPWLNIRENLEICTKDFQELDSYLKHLKLEDLSKLYPDQLSGGMIQKINILRSFLGKPDLILMDEPFVHIDSIQKEDLHKFLLNLWQTFHPTIIFVTHDIDEALYLSQYISLYNSKIKSISSTMDVAKVAPENLIALKDSPEYQNHFKNIYNHLKQEKLL